MFFHRSMLGAATVALIGLPYVMSTGDKDQRADETPQAKAANSEALDKRLASLPTPSPSISEHSARSLPLAGAPVGGFDDILRFDATPDWVLGRWPRISTTTNQPELKGYRVPVVTGARAEDLAGSLTYYFNAQQELQRIVFHGTTGDPQPLAKFVTERFSFRRAKDGEAGWQRYQVVWNGEPVSELRVRPAQVVDATQPHRRYQINLLIQRPQSTDGSPDSERKFSNLRL